MPTNEKLVSITDPKELGELLPAIDAYSGSHTVRTALRLAPLVFVRPTELRLRQGTLTVHGFRSTASTLLNEQGWNPDAIERQLAHGARDEVRTAYNHAEYLPERKLMMHH